MIRGESTGEDRAEFFSRSKKYTSKYIQGTNRTSGEEGEEPAATI